MEPRVGQHGKECGDRGKRLQREGKERKRPLLRPQERKLLLRFFKLHFMKPHLSLTEVKIFFFFFPFKVGLVSKVIPSGFR